MKLSRVGKIVRLVKHAEFGKYMKRSTTIMFHDAEEKSKVGDTVLIDASRPFSARKRHQLVEVVRTASGSSKDDIL
jgi:small subunit ribosomal protein S17